MNNNKMTYRLPSRLLALLLLLITLGTVNVWGQTDYSGVYYIASDNSASGSDDGTKYSEATTDAQKYYLVPAANPQQTNAIDAYYSPNHNETPGDPEKPFLTTYHTNKDLNSIWIVKKTGDYYYVIHALTGKYVIYEVPQPNHSNNQRKTMHLQTPDDGTYSLSTNNNYQFNITLASSIYRLQPRNRSGWYWNPANGNKNKYYGQTADIYQSGLVGVFNSSSDGGSKWHFENTKLPAPTIVYNSDNDKFTISYDKIPAGFEILYTVDGSEPTIGGATTQTYTNESVITLATIGDNSLKAVVVQYGLILTETALIKMPANPTITPTLGDCNNKATITSDEGTNVYYTLDGTDPTNSSTYYTEPFILTSDATIKAVAYSGNLHSGITTYHYSPNYSTKPIITTTFQSGVTVTISGTGTIYYTIDGTEPTTSSTQYTNPFPITGSSGDVITIKAVAKESEKELSCVVEKTVTMGYFINDLSQLEGISSHLNDLCILTSDINASGLSESINGFTGTFDGGYYTISGLTKPLFTNLNGGVVKNVMLKGVQISGSGNVGAIAGEASGYTRIYNCGILPSDNKYESESSYVSSSDGNCGGLVGLLNDDSRVINCFSYANITGGETVAGIVGYNNFASTAEESDGKYAKLKTAVVNCMFYGNITGGTTRYPVYGGEKILNNNETGINNYDFYRAEANLSLAGNDHYNCSWPAQEEYLTKYEYYRYLLNSNRELCGWWVGAPSAPSEMSTTDVQAVPKDASLMAKWVLDPSIAPYPILKAPGKYYSAINQDPVNRINPVSKTWESRSTSSNTITTKAAPDTEGQKLGSITVNINKGGGFGGSDSKVIPITAMDIDNNDFCYGKIQLPYYNSIFGDPSVEITGTTAEEKKSRWASRYGGNYGDKVVVGWEITSVTGGTEGTLVKNWQDGYNFADRDCTNKDKERIFAQGGYYYVPNGVSAITITAKWADATYLDNNDNYYDRISVSSVSSGTANATLSPFAPAGTRSTKLGNGKTVKTGAILSNLLSGDVYEKAIVLVGNNQNFTGNKSYGGSTNGFTVMSADFDLDDEPDYSLIWQLGNQTSRYSICPIRFDFIPVIEMGMAMKEDGSTQYYSLGCYRPLGHFEVTETSLIHFGQFEFGNKDRSLVAPLILNGGIYDQYTKGTLGKETAEAEEKDDKINYIIIGGNVRIPSFTPGAHPSDRSSAVQPTRHCALNVMGGDIDYLYLTGNYNEAITPNQDNPHCYIDGGNIKQVAAAGKEGIDGDVFFKINHSVIEEFYGGSTMDQSTGNNFKTVKGNINVTVDNSKITKYCGGPKFGNMNLDEDTPANNKTVTTNASGTTFGVYYGGGNGGTSYVQYAKTDVTEANAQNPYDWNGGNKGKLNSYTPNTYRSTDKNYMADYEMEIVNSSAGTDANKGIFRTYFYAAQFSATNTGPITNNLKDCKVLTSFYGGGNLGGVIGDVTSTLTDTEVLGSAFGAGYSASVPEVTIYNKDKTAPTLNVYTGIVTPAPDPDPNSNSNTYTWCYKNKTTNVVIPSGVVIPNGVGTGNPAFEYGGKKYFYTEESLENLGTVTGKVTLNIEGKTTVKHSAYGGGEESGVDGNTYVNVESGTIGTDGLGGAEYGNVYGGGKGKDDDVNAGLVKGNTNVNISGTTETTKIIHNVYGGGAFGSVGTFTAFDAKGFPTACTENTGTANITITGGTFGSNGHENGMIFGSSRGSEGDPEIDTNIDKVAWVNETNVIIGTQNAESNTNPWIKGSVYGGGENGHNLTKGHVTVHSGTIGITDSNIDGGARYSTRGNVYGAGCGTDTFDRGEGDNKKTYYVFNAGIVLGNTQIDIDGGHIVHNVYGGGAMGSVGTYTLADDAYHAAHTDVPIGMPYECKTGTGTCTINITGGKIGMTNATMTGHGNDGPDDFGHIFGAGRGYSKDPNVYPNIEGCAFFNNTNLTIGGTALVCGSVYGGSESGHVLNNANVTISGGQIGCGVGRTTAYTDDDFNTTSLPGTAHWTNDANGAPYDQYASPTGTYDYSAFPKIPEADRKATSEGGLPVATDGRTFYGNVFAGGSGYYPYAPGLWLKSAGHIGGTATVTVSGGHILNNLYGGCEMADIDGAVTVTMTGGTVGVPRTKEDITDNPNYGNVYGAGMGDKRIFFNTSTNVASTTVNISNGTIYGSVFGGGEDGHVLGNAVTTISEPEGKTTLIGCDGLSDNDGNVFGAGQGHTGALTAGVVGGNASLTVTGGTMKGSVYGGGRIASVGTYFAMATIDDPNNPGQKIPNPNYGKMQDGDDHGCLTVSLTGGTIEQNVYGGCMGSTVNVLYGESKNVLVELNNGKTGTDKGCIVKGDIFGCNNVNSTPQGDVEVHIYATQNADAAATQIANSGEITTAKVKGRYDVNAVYGGGNLATYNPVTAYNGTSGSKTRVIIEGCDLSSIETVYGGGNAAAVPETDVTIKSAYEIGYLFGGGNGKDDIAPSVPNPGADVGTPDHGASTYGTGNANTLMEGGLIHEAYGGSNTKGIIKGSIYQITDPKDPSVDPDCCVLEVEKIVGAGKYADIDGDVNMTLSCQPDRKVNLLFAGADEANVNGNITLNITNGHFGKVFGGNNLGGAIKGKITVNVEETGCQPIKIDDLYLGSNEAAYSVFGYYESEDPVTGKKILKPRTSADDSHTPVENPAKDATHTFPYAQPVLNIISCTYIGNVFGGGFGEGAVMYADPKVNVNMVPGRYAETAVPAMMEELGLDVTKTAPNPDKLGIIRNVFGGGDAANVAGDTYVNIATEANKGAYIIGSIFGGGNAADVLGNTNVTVSGGYVFNGIFGGGYAGNVGTFIERSYTEKTDVGTDTEFDHSSSTHTCIGKPTKCKTGTGKCTVVVNGGQIGPISVALKTEGMNRPDEYGGPVPEGWVWGAGQGLVEDPAEHPDTHFSSYVGSTDVTIGGTALIMESIIGGGEFGRVLGNTLVKIEGGQIGIGEGKVDGDNKPIRYTDDQFVNPLTTTITDANSLTECSHYPYGRNIGTTKNPNWVYLPYDPYCEKYPDYFAAHQEFAPASTSNPSDGKTWIGCVFAGGSGYMPYLKKDGSGNPIGYDWCPSAGLVEGDTEVRISGGHILTNVYGGNEITDVKGKSIVKMTGGTIGVPRTLKQIVEHPLTCYLFGAGKGDERSRFYNYTNTGSVEVEISGGIIYGSVFGGSEDGHVTGDIKMDIKPGAIIGTWGTSYVDGNVFGGGRGFSGNTLTAGNVGGNVTMNISGGNILGSVYGGGRLASVGTYLVETTDDNYGKQIPDNGNEKHGHITINISGGTIGNDKEYIYNPTAEQKAAIPNTTFDYQNHLQYAKGGNVFTGGMGRLYALDGKTVLTSWQKLGQCKQTTLKMTGGTVKSSVYGGGEIGIVAQNATVNIDGGTVGTKIADTEDATKYYYFGSVFGGGKGSKENITDISAAGTTQGNVEVHLNKAVASDDDAKGAIVHQVFGCNDMNGSPKGNVTVHVYATQNADKDNISTKYDKETNQFDVEAVYGGGNLAAYEPTNLETGKTNVIIDGCRLTSIKQVYGGGNAASTPATNVTVNGTYEILELFGGGNGFDKLPDGKPNPGANVGYKNYTVYEQAGDDWKAKDDPAYDTKEERTAPGSAISYGTGQASLNVYGGTIHRVFGGSNTKGNVRQTAVTLMDEKSKCPFNVDEAYGGGKSAPMDAEAKLLMACIPGLQAAYGGAEAAAIKGNVTLNITNGTFDRVFGGNNLSGTIDGSITVNIEEVSCRPIIIGELYGGGNLAGYSVNGYNNDGTPKESGPKLYDDPQINVMSFTSIGKIFGGGYGERATMVGNPTVNVNEVYGKYYDDDASVVGEDAKTSGNYPIPSHAVGKMGAIHTVFGGGNAAKVIGNTTVNIATLSDVYIVKQVTADAALPEGCYTRSGAGTTASPYVYTPASGTASADVTYYEKQNVLGVDIRDNVYGGGNNAEVTGNTNVNIGKKKTE